MLRHTLSSGQIDSIRKLVAGRYISVAKHPQFDLFIYNYTAKTQYERYWTEDTMMCRGLILDSQGQIIARSFPKFFNLDEYQVFYGKSLPRETFEVYEKLDGSLGILYQHQGIKAIATRGRFDSIQATAANQILRKKYNQVKFDVRYTYLFEIILPENRIVVDYQSVRDLFLLAIIDTESGKEIPVRHDLGFPLPNKYQEVSDLSKLDTLQEKDKEGFVVAFKSGLRLKVKFDEYVRLHRLITGLSPKQIWEFLRQGKNIDELLELVPDEFYSWVKQVVNEILKKYKVIEETSRREFKDLGDRKKTALYFKSCTYPAILFAMLDAKDFSQIIWKMVRPESAQTFRKDE